MMSQEDVLKLDEAFATITQNFPLNDELKQSLSRLKLLLRRLEGLLKEYKNVSFLNLFKRSKLKKEGESLSEKIISDLKKFNDEASDYIMDYLNEKNRECRDIAMLMGIGVEPIRVEPISSLGDEVTRTLRIRDASLKFREYLDELFRKAAEKTKELWNKNHLKLATYRKFVTVDLSSVPVSNMETLEFKDLSEMVETYKRLKDETKILDELSDKVRGSFNRVLNSRLDNLQSYIDAVRREGVNVPSEMYSKLNSMKYELSKDLTISELQSYEREINDLEERLRDLLRQEILKIRHKTMGAVEGIKDIPEPPHIPIGSVDKLIEALQEIKTWQMKVFNHVVALLRNLVDDVESVLDKLPTPKYEEVVSITFNFKESLSDIKGIEDAVIMYRRFEEHVDRWKNMLIDDLNESFERYKNALNMIGKIIESIPRTLMIKMPEDVKSLSFSEIFDLLSKIEKLSSRKDKLFKDALVGKLNQIVESIKILPEKYKDFFSSLKEDVESYISKINDASDVEEARLLFVKAREDIKNRLSSISSEIKNKTILRTRLAITKIPNIEVSVPWNGLESLNLDYDNINIFVSSIEEFKRENVIKPIKEGLMKILDDYISIFSSMEEFDVDFGDSIKKLKELKKKIEETEEIEPLGDLGKEFNNILSSKEVISKLMDWIDLMKRSFYRTLEVFESNVSNLESIREIIKEVEEIDFRDLKKVSETLIKVLKVWNVMRDYIVKLEEMEHRSFVEKLKKIPEYNLIERVYEERKEEFNNLVYPLLTLEKLRGDFPSIKTPKIIDALEDIRELERGWLEKAKEIYKWHKALRMIVSGIDLSGSDEEKREILKDVRRKISEMYTRMDISSYLSWLVEIVIMGRR
ncbi:MAG: hypothetical protein ACTSYT_01555 [Candidatus Asgardarchaeia archaeon]